MKVIGRTGLILGICYLTFLLLTQPAPWIFLDGVNLLIHEAGHLVFAIMGEFVTMLGGTILQLLVPMMFLGYFGLRREFFSASVMLFWVADNLINISVYMKDAQEMSLPLLVEGSIHDWNWIFGKLGLLDYAQGIGGSVFVLGEIFALVSIVGMIYLTLIEEIGKQ